MTENKTSDNVSYQLNQKEIVMELATEHVVEFAWWLAAYNFPNAFSKREVTISDSEVK